MSLTRDISTLSYAIRIGVAVIIAVASLTVAQKANAQSSGRISGVVRDGQLRSMANVEVVLSTRKYSRTTHTNESGEYAFENIANGRAVIVARHPGYGATRRFEAFIKDGSAHTIEVILYERRGMPASEFDPYYNKPVDFSAPRGLSLGLVASHSTPTLAIGTANSSGSANSMRAEVGLEFDKHWMFAIRGGVALGGTSGNVDYRFNSQNTLTFRDYRTSHLDAGVRYLLLKSDRRIRPYINGAFGLSWFNGDVDVSTVANPVRTRGSGLVLSWSGGVQVELKRNLALDVSAEWFGASYESWRFDNAVLGLPNLRLLGTDITVAARWWPSAR